MLGANFSAIAMETQGDRAGTASALYGFFTTAVSSVFGYFVSSQFNGSVIPILIGFIFLGLFSLITVIITENGVLFGATTTK
jgi:DHA1 family bicyclomycin/chloramphenicol resistance-like MFS transporter